MSRMLRALSGFTVLCICFTVFLVPPAPKAHAANARLGLHVTQAELDEWRDRAVNGPYKSASDVSANSPGEWDKIVANKNSFNTGSNHLANLWSGPDHPFGTPVPQGNTGSIPTGSVMDSANKMLDAAFYAMVMQDAGVAAKVKARIVAQFDLSAYPKLDFSNRSYWAKDIIMDVGPNFIIAEWLTLHIHAMDYIEILNPNAFTSSERTDLLHNFERFADVLDHDSNAAINNDLFVDRDNGDYTPKNPPGWNSEYPYYDAPRTFAKISRYYNNRRLGCMAYVALVGVHQNIPAYKESAKKMMQEYIMFGVYKEGYTTDFHRWDDNGRLADLGLTYAASLLGHIVKTADLLARTGDTSLYDFETTDSTLGFDDSAAAGKSLLTTAKHLAMYLDDSYERYGTDESGKNGDPYYRIDDHYGDGQQHLSELRMLLGGNMYYNDPYLKSVYMRTAEDTNAYTTSVDQPYWRGPGKVFPSVLFMFGQMEGIAYENLDGASANLSLNATATATTTCGGSQGADKAIDGSLATKWCDATPGDKTLTLDLGTKYSISRWVVKHAGAGGESVNYNTTDFKLQESNDGIAWTDVDSVTGNTANVTDRLVPAFNSRYVRLLITDPAVWFDTARIYEFEVYETGNQALNKQATATTTCTGSQGADLAVDGSLATKWCDGTAGDKTLKLDLGTGYVVSRWIVKHASAGGESVNYNTTAFKLQKSNDGSTWTDVDSVTGNTAGVTDRTVVPFTSRYVRLYITDAGVWDNTARIYEFEVYP